MMNHAKQCLTETKVSTIETTNKAFTVILPSNNSSSCASHIHKAVVVLHHQSFPSPRQIAFQGC